MDQYQQCLKQRLVNPGLMKERVKHRSIRHGIAKQASLILIN